MAVQASYTPISLKHLALFVLITTIWGFNFAVVKIGIEHVPPIMLTMLRFTLVAAILVPLVKVPRGRFKDIFIVSVTLGVLHFSLMFSGLTGVDASTAAIAIQLQVPFASILAAVFFSDKLGWWRGLGMAIAFVGVAIIAGEPRLDGQYVHLAMVISAACIWAVANLIMKKQKPMDGMQLLGWMSAMAAPQLLAISLVLEQGHWQALTTLPWQAVFSVVYQAVLVVVLGYGLWHSLIQRYDMNQTMPITLLVPPFGVLSGVLVLGETLTVTFLIGAAVTIVGVGIIVIRRPRFQAPGAERV